MFALISVISINMREFKTNELLAPLLYGEFRNIKTNYHSTIATPSVVHFHIKKIPGNTPDSFKAT